MVKWTACGRGLFIWNYFIMYSNMQPFVVIIVFYNSSMSCQYNVCSFYFRYQWISMMKIAVIGQSLFGQEVYKELKKDGHTIVGVFTIPDKDGKVDTLGKSPVLFISCNFMWLLRTVHTNTNIRHENLVRFSQEICSDQKKKNGQ